MNYFGHGYRFVHDPYFLAGTAVPDWLSVINRRVRARARSARLWTGDPDPRVAALAAGVVRHHEDDAWFHRTRAFAELSLALAVDIREQLSDDRGFRPSFLGHILVEVLLDGALIARDPDLLDRYYEALARVDPHAVCAAVERIAGAPVPDLADLIPLFRAERFLYDYLDDVTLLARLNRVMRRVALPPLPPEFLSFLPEARRRVSERCDELIHHVTDPGTSGEQP